MFLKIIRTGFFGYLFFLLPISEMALATSDVVLNSGSTNSSSSNSPTTQIIKLKGEAMNSKGELVYTENTTLTEDNQGFAIKIETEYTNPKGDVFATMQSEFKKNELIPDISFEDKRFQVKNNLSFDPEKKQISMAHEENKKDKKTELPLKENMVAGSGFHNFLLKNFDQLSTSKEKININFVVLAKMDYFNFDILKKNESETEITFTMKLHSWLLRQFLSPIEVKYDKKTKRLVQFQGLTNIQSDQDKPQQLIINYSYKE